MKYPATQLFSKAPRPRAVALTGLLAATALAGCASIVKVDATDPQGQSQHHEISVTRTVTLAYPIEKIFDLVAAEDVLPKVLTGYAFLPAVTGTSGNTGPWTLPGSQRTVHLADQTTANEELTVYQRAKRFEYKVNKFTHPILSTLAASARGVWRFEETPVGTKVDWTYTFVATNGLAALPLSSVAQLLWRGYMDVCLRNVGRILADSKPS